MSLKSGRLLLWAAILLALTAFALFSPRASAAVMYGLAFDPAGNLFGVGSIGGPQLYSINQVTGQATVIGSTGLTSTSGGGLGISPSNVFFGTPTSTRFGTYNSITGAYTNIAAPT